MIDEKLLKKFPKEQIEEAMRLLAYHNAPELPKEESDTLPTMYIFRHGQSEDNAEFSFSGWRDPGLTQKGIEHAEVLAEKIKDKKLQMLISSPQKRAIETMKIAISKNPYAKKLEITTDDRIKERSYGELQGKSKLLAQLENPKLLETERRSFDYVLKGGESIEMVCKRVADFCDSIIPIIKETGVNVAISCHGNSIRGFRRYFEKLSDAETASIETPLAQDYAAYIIK